MGPISEPPTRLLRDDRSEAELAEEGWTTLPLLDRATTEQLADAYPALHPHGGTGFDTDFAYVEAEHRRQVDRLLRPIVEEALVGAFAPVQAFNLSFITKWPDNRSALPLHQDWTYVDEPAQRSVSVWIPLCDVGPELDNGPVAVLPRSHLLPCERRGMDVDRWFAPWSEPILDHLEAVPVSAGEALVFDNRLLHASAPNRSDQPRVAVCCMVAARDLPLRYVQIEPDQETLWEVDRDFFVVHSPLHLRSGPRSHARVVDQRARPAFSPPLDDLAEVCGVEVRHLAPVTPAPPPNLPGSPLGSASVQRTLRILDPLGPFEELASLAALAWDALGAEGVTELGRRPGVEAWGPWQEIEVVGSKVGSAPPALDQLMTRLRDIEGVVTASLHLMGPELTILPRAEETSDVDVVILPVRCSLPLGSAAVQVGSAIEALRPGVPLAFDPAQCHAAWSLGTRPTLALVITLRRGSPSPVTLAAPTRSALPALPPPTTFPASLRDPLAQAEFHERGYTVVDFVDPEALGRLRAVAHKHHPHKGERTWESDFYSPSREAKQEIASAIKEALEPGMARHLTGHRAVMTNFVVNWPGPDGGLTLHQHSSVVDERRYRSVIIWCALNDATEANGTLHVVPRSHLVPYGPWGEQHPDWFAGHRQLIYDRYLTSVEVAAGQALVFDNALLHCSFANMTAAPRMTAVAILTPLDADLRYYEWVQDGLVRAYALDPQFFFDRVSSDFQMARPEGLEFIEDVEVPILRPTEADLATMLAEGTCRHVPHT